MTHKKEWVHWIWLWWLFLIFAVACNSEGLSGPFKKLLAEAKMEFTAPQGFQPLPPEANPLLSYEHGMRSEDGKLEVRYAIRPTSQAKINYSDPPNSAQEPGQLFNMLASLAEQLASGGETPRREYTPEQAKELFNADGAAAAVFDVNRLFSKDHSQGLLVAIHKNNQADAYMVFLFNSYPEVKQRIHTTLPSLRFSN